jgi:hypothetical protein
VEVGRLKAQVGVLEGERGALQAVADASTATARERAAQLHLSTRELGQLQGLQSRVEALQEQVGVCGQLLWRQPCRHLRVLPLASCCLRACAVGPAAIAVGLRPRALCCEACRGLRLSVAGRQYLRWGQVCWRDMQQAAGMHSLWVLRPGSRCKHASGTCNQHDRPSRAADA